MQLWLSPYAQNCYWTSTLEDPQYPTFPKLPMTKPSLNTKIQSKRDISKNYLILQCIKRKLILIENVEKKREICVHNAQTNSLKVVQTKIQWREWSNIQTHNKPHILFPLYSRTEDDTHIPNEHNRDKKNRVKYYFGP